MTQNNKKDNNIANQDFINDKYINKNNGCNEKSIEYNVSKYNLEDLITMRNKKSFILINLIKFRCLVSSLEKLSGKLDHYDDIIHLINLVSEGIEEDLKELNSELIIKISEFIKKYGKEEGLKFINKLKNEAPDLNLVRGFENFENNVVKNFYFDDEENYIDDLTCGDILF